MSRPHSHVDGARSRRHVPTGRARRVLAALLGVVTATSLVVVGPTAAAPTESATPRNTSQPNPKPVFLDPVFDYDGGPSPVAYLGYGTTGLAYVSESNEGTAAAAFGHDQSDEEAVRFAGTSNYVGSPSLSQRDVLDADVARSVDEVTGQMTTNAVEISRVGTQPWVAHYQARQHEGFAHPPYTWTFGASTPTSTSVPGQPIGVVMLTSPVGFTTVRDYVVFATTTGLYEYSIQTTATGATANLVSLLTVGDQLPYPPAAIDIDRGPELPDVVNPMDPYDSNRFVVVTRASAASGLVPTTLHLIDGVLEFPGNPNIAQPLLNEVVRTAAPFSTTANETVDVRYSILDRTAASNSTDRDLLIALRNGGVYSEFDVAEVSGTDRIVAAGGNGECDTSSARPANKRFGFDFHAFTLSRSPGTPNGSPLSPSNWGRTSSGYSALTCMSNDDVDPDVVNVHARWDDNGHGSAAFSSLRAVSSPVAGDRWVDPQAFVTLPCLETTRIGEAPNLPNVQCVQTAAFSQGGGFFGTAALMGVTQSGAVTRPEATSSAYVVVRPPYAGGALRHWYRELPRVEGGGAIRHLTPLPRTRIDFAVELQPQYLGCVAGNSAVCDAGLVEDGVSPLPIAVLAAPPKVAGAGQEMSGTTFAVGSSQTGGQSYESSARVGASLGMEVEDPTGAFSIGAEVAYETEVTGSTAESSTVSRSTGYVADPDEDSLVLNTYTAWRVVADVIASSTGVAMDTTVTIDSPRTTGTELRSWEYVRSTYPDVYGTGTEMGRGIADVLDHSVGDPGTYRSYFDSDGSTPSGVVDDFCIGSQAGDEEIRIDPGPRAAPNPFSQDPEPYTPEDAVLVSSPAVVAPGGGSGVVEQSVGLEQGAEESFLRTHSLDASVNAKVAYVTASVSAGGTWGEGRTFSVSDSTEFSGGVGNIPSAALTDEGYEWRMFVCKRNLRSGSLGVSVPVWVVHYTVDGYEGSGPQPIGTTAIVSPTDNEIVSSRPTLVWDQPEGQVQRFEWKVFEVDGSQPVATGQVTYPNPTAGTAPGQVQVTLDPDDELDPGTEYSWTVQAFGFLGEEGPVEEAFFRTAGQPLSTFTHTPSAPTVGAAVTLTADAPDSPTTQFRWDVDGTELFGRQVVHEFGEPGARPVSLTVTTSVGTSTTAGTVPVRGVARDDSYATAEDTELAVGAPGVLGNDVADRAQLAGSSLNGTVRLAVDGAFTYMPDADFCGTDAFTYTATGNGQPAGEATVTVDVECTDDPTETPTETPTGTPTDPEDPDFEIDDGYSTDGFQDTPITGQLPPVDESDVTYVAVGPATNGTVTIAPDGSFTFVPADGFCGTATFRYRVVADDGRESNVVSVPIEVICDEDPTILRVLGGPVAIADNVVGEIAAATGRDTRRLAGIDRYATSVAVATDAWPNGAGTVFVATGTAFPDGLGGGAAAARLGGPMLLTPTDELLEVTRDALVQLAPSRVVILGGENAVSQRVADSIAAVTALRPERVAGGDRYDTSAGIARLVWPDGADTVYVATGAAFPDALSGAAAAARVGAPVLLSQPDALPQVTADALDALSPSSIVLLGGDTALAPAVAAQIAAATGVTPRRIAGADRYDTASQIARDGWPDGTPSTYLATGRSFPDALSGAAAAGRRGHPVLLVDTTSLPAPTRSVLSTILSAR